MAVADTLYLVSIARARPTNTCYIDILRQEIQDMTNVKLPLL